MQPYKCDGSFWNNESCDAFIPSTIHESWKKKLAKREVDIRELYQKILEIKKYNIWNVTMRYKN